jgi:hypothetical protein
MWAGRVWLDKIFCPLRVSPDPIGAHARTKYFVHCTASHVSKEGLRAQWTNILSAEDRFVLGPESNSTAYLLKPVARDGRVHSVRWVEETQWPQLNNGTRSNDEKKQHFVMFLRVCESMETSSSAIFLLMNFWQFRPTMISIQMPMILLSRRLYLSGRKQNLKTLD